MKTSSGQDERPASVGRQVMQTTTGEGGSDEITATLQKLRQHADKSKYLEYFMRHRASPSVCRNTGIYSVAMRMLNELGRAHDTQKLYTEITSRRKITSRHSSNLSGIMLSALVQTHDGKRITEFFRSVPEEEISGEHFEALLDFYGTKHKNFQEIDKLLSQMMRLGVKPRLRSMVRLMELASSTRDASKMWDYFNYLDIYGLKPNKNVHTTMIEGFFRIPDTESITQYFEDHGRFINHDIFHSALSLCGHRNLPDLMDGLLDLMKEFGRCPSHTTYTIVLQAYADWSRKDPAMEERFVAHLDRVADACANPRGLWFLVKTCGKLRKFDQMKTVIARSIDQSNVAPDIKLYNMLIDVYRKNNMEKDMLDAFSQLKQRGLSPDHYTYTNLIKFYGERNRVGDAMSYYEVARKLEHVGIQDSGIHDAAIDCQYSLLRMFPRLCPQNFPLKTKCLTLAITRTCYLIHRICHYAYVYVSVHSLSVKLIFRCQTGRDDGPLLSDIQTNSQARNLYHEYADQPQSRAEGSRIGYAAPARTPAQQRGPR